MSWNIENIKIIKEKVTEETCIDLTKKNKVYTFLNCYSYYVFRKNIDSFKSIDAIFCDGIIFEKMMRSINIKASRVSFDMTSLAPIVFNYASEHNEKLVLIGSEEGVAKSVKDILSENFVNLDIIDVRHGFFQSETERLAYIDYITKINPTFVIAGMGTPHQENFIVELKNAGWQGIGFTCGGFLHQTCKKGINYYPKLINNLNLRWAYRIWDEPKLLKRYVLYYPLSVIAFYYDYFKFRIVNVSKKSPK
ncbi:WecB/TagA/CpsF family glycosyltransferase [Serratia sp. JSRIV006]|uniref:WecB/TagA/CpsF family glycosyltransferase n=1 Tax=Serratia sp. JSRIV006 TaxID=2831896 RepID=UPI001CBE6DCC|nr:WecB/TagA/CpsF family glycosyltransferase [Serratia sp. JSRIV006]UAN64715.1 WecB/TagA/CpsF family glycosyltransferase [Serratia sp. JSRIV006]